MASTDIASSVITGRLTRDAELNDSGKVLRLGIASNYSVKRDDEYEEEVSYFTAKILGKRAKSLAPHLKQGQQVTVAGPLRQERWETDDGKRSAVVVLVNDLVFGQKARGQADDDDDGDDDAPWGS